MVKGRPRQRSASDTTRQQSGMAERFNKLAKEVLDEEKVGWVLAEGETTNSSTIRCEDLVGYLENSVELTAGWKSLPLTVYFFLIFVVSLLLHTQPSTVYECESAIQGIITTATFTGSLGTEFTLEDVHDSTQFWPWILEALVPATFVQTDSSGDPLPPEKWGRVATFNQIIGGITLAQVRTKSADCEMGILQDISNSKCHPSGTSSSKSYLPLGTDLSGYSSSVQQFINQSFIMTDSGVYEAWMQSIDSVSVVKQELELLRDLQWIDKHTDHVTLRTVLYNGELSLLSQVQLTFVFQRGGLLVTDLSLQTIQADFYSSKFVYALDILWIISLTILMASEIADIYKFRATFMKDYLSDHWNLLDWACIAWGYAVSAIFLKIVVEIGDSVDKLQNIPAQGDPRFFPYIRELDSSLEQQLQLADTWRVLAGSNIFLIMCRFFKSFRAQPRLSVVTRTLHIAAVDFVHFFIVFTTIWFCYVCSGYFLFGERLQSFSTVAGSSQICLLILLGDPAFWEEIGQSHYVFASLWFWTYIILVYLVLLNMLIAILIDTYTQVKSSLSANAPTLWSQTYDAFIAHRKAIKGSTSYQQIIDKLKTRDKDEVIAPETLVSSLGLDLENNQAKAIIRAGIKYVASATRRKGGVSLSEAMKHIRRLNESFNTTHDRISGLERELVKQDEVLQDINEIVSELLIDTRPAPAK